MEQHKIQMTVPSGQGRNECFDVMRGIGIVLMLMGHIGFGDEFGKVIYTFNMPLFFFISGYFFNPRKYLTVKDYIEHNAKSLLIPYVSFSLFYQLLHFIYTGEYSLKYFLVSILCSNHYRIDVAGAMWFLQCLFSVKIIYFLLYRSFKSEICFASIIVIVTIIGNNLRNICILPFCLDSAMSCMLLMWIGMLIKEKGIFNGGKTKKCNLRFMAFFCMFIILLITANMNGVVVIRRNRFGNVILYWISCISGIGITAILSEFISNKDSFVIRLIKNMLCFIGKNSIVYLVLNELIIYVVGQIMQFIGGNQYNVANSYFLHIVMLGIVGVVLAVISLVLNKTRLKFFIGK